MKSSCLTSRASSHWAKGKQKTANVIEDSLGFWIPHRGIQIFFVGRIWIADYSGIIAELSCILESKVQDSRIPLQKFAGFLIPQANNLPNSGMRIPSDGAHAAY